MQSNAIKCNQGNAIKDMHSLEGLRFVIWRWIDSKICGLEH